MVRKIVGVKDPILRKKAKRVQKIDKRILRLVKDMHETLEAQKDPEGVALAAPQIGKNLAIFVVSFDNQRRVVINPEILNISKEKVNFETSENKDHRELEGCLSIPHYYSPIERAKKIKIRYLNEKGKLIVESFSGFMARIVQHETDHLNGILFTDHVLKQRKPLYKASKEGWEEVELK